LTSLLCVNYMHKTDQHSNHVPTSTTSPPITYPQALHIQKSRNHKHYISPVTYKQALHLYQSGTYKHYISNSHIPTSTTPPPITYPQALYLHQSRNHKHYISTNNVPTSSTSQQSRTQKH